MIHVPYIVHGTLHSIRRNKTYFTENLNTVCYSWKKIMEIKEHSILKDVYEFNDPFADLIQCFSYRKSSVMRWVNRHKISNNTSLLLGYCVR